MEPIPNTIGRYVVENLVGVGGMGQIYKAHDPDIGRSVAIKLISTKLMSSADRAEYLRRFRREAQAAARCAHPNIVAVYDFALHEGQPFIAMEFVYGVSLRQALDAAPVMAVPDAIRIMLQVLDAMSSAHALGVIHQDIKPANIMLTPEMRVKVADFGISRIREHGGHECLVIDGHAQLHVTGAMPWQYGRRSLRPFFGRGDAVRNGRWRARFSGL